MVAFGELAEGTLEVGNDGDEGVKEGKTRGWLAGSLLQLASSAAVVTTAPLARQLHQDTGRAYERVGGSVKAPRAACGQQRCRLNVLVRRHAFRVHPLYLGWYLYTVALNIKDGETERLAAEVAELAADTKTGAIRVALQERKARLNLASDKSGRRERLQRFLEDEAWPQLPPKALGAPVTKAEREAILGYGALGV